MPDVNLAAKRYARAAFELAVEANALDTWSNAINQMADFMSDAEVRRVLENTRVTKEAKQQLIVAALADLPGLTLNFARLLVRKGRTNLASEIAEEFRAMMEQRQGVARARAVTAIAMSDSERNALTERLRQQTGRQVLLQTEVDPAVLGGVVVQIGDRLVDASTRARLEALRQNLVGSVS